MKKKENAHTSNGPFIDLNAAWMNNHDALAERCGHLNQAMQAANQSIYTHMREASTQTPAGGGDLLLHWVQQLAWSSRQYHQVLSEWLTAYVDQAPDLEPATRQQARFWVRQINEMLSPANFFWTNNNAVKRFVRSDGKSLLNG